MTQQPIQQQQQMQQVHRDADTRLGVLESAVADIRTVMQDIRHDLKARTSINWAPISLLATVLIAFGTLGVGYLSTNQTRLEGMIAKQEARAERYVPREDLANWIQGIEKNVDSRFQVSGDRRNDAQARTDDRFVRNERDIDGLQKAVVPRGEHEQMWAGQRTKDDALQRQIDELRKGLTDLNTPRDTIQGMQRRIDELERERRRGPT